MSLGDGDCNAFRARMTDLLEMSKKLDREPAAFTCVLGLIVGGVCSELIMAGWPPKAVELFLANACAGAAESVIAAADLHLQKSEN